MRLNILLFALGILLLQCSSELPSVTVQVGATVTAFLCAVGGALWRQRLGRWAMLAAAAFLVGFVWAAMRADIRLGDDLSAAWEGRDIELIGVVAEMAQPFASGERFVFDVEEVQTAGARVPEKIMLSRYAQTKDGAERSVTVRPGERWRFTVRLKRPHGNANPGGFDYEAWLLERGVRATGYVRPASASGLLDHRVFGLSYYVEALRHDIRQRFLDALPGQEHAGVLVALAVGDQRAIQGEYWRLFSRTGTTHLMSISGLHVTMVAAMLGLLVGFFWRRSTVLMAAFPAQRAAVLSGWLAAMAYALLSGFSVPAQRTAYMLTVAALALVAGRQTAPTRTLAVALLLVLLFDPWAVLAPGFWLSFGAVALLFYVAVGRLDTAVGWRSVLRQWSVAQWAVTIGSLPLLLLFFQQFSLVSPLANALAIPVVSFVVTPIALLAVVIPLPLLLQFDHALLSLLMEVLAWMAELPVLEVPAPPVERVILGVAGIVWLLLPRGIPARWLGGLMLLPALLFTPPGLLPDQVRATVLDVGQGLAVVVQTASKTLLYDTGPLYSAESDAGQRIVVPYLRAIGVRRLDAMIVTHSDSDHAGGAASVMATMPVKRVLSSVPELPGETCVAGQGWEWDGVRFEILHPTAFATSGRLDKPNHRSCVLRISAAGQAMLLTSDIEAPDERALLERDAQRLKADVLLVPHHGSRTSSTAPFVAAVGARHVIYPVGYRNRFGHPRADVVERYGGAWMWRTDRDGALSVSLGNGVQVDAWRQVRRRYWHGR